MVSLSLKLAQDVAFAYGEDLPDHVLKAFFRDDHAVVRIFINAQCHICLLAEERIPSFKERQKHATRRIAFPKIREKYQDELNRQRHLQIVAA